MNNTDPRKAALRAQLLEAITQDMVVGAIRRVLDAWPWSRILRKVDGSVVITINPKPEAVTVDPDL